MQMTTYVSYSQAHKTKQQQEKPQNHHGRSSCWMAICLWDTWICHSLSNIEVCANASGNMSKHQPARKRLKKSTLAASTLSHAVFSYVQTSNKLGIHVPSDTLQWQEHFKWQSSGMLVFSYVQTSSKPCSNLKSMGPDDASRCDRILKESSINFFLCHGNSRFRPLPRIEVWLGFVHMKTQQIKGVVMAWLSPIECAAQRCFQSMPGVCTYENTAHRRCHQKSAHSSVKWAARRH